MRMASRRQRVHEPEANVNDVLCAVEGHAEGVEVWRIDGPQRWVGNSCCQGGDPVFNANLEGPNNITRNEQKEKSGQKEKKGVCVCVCVCVDEGTADRQDMELPGSPTP